MQNLPNAVLQSKEGPENDNTVAVEDHASGQTLHLEDDNADGPEDANKGPTMRAVVACARSSGLTYESSITAADHVDPVTITQPNPSLSLFADVGQEPDLVLTGSDSILSEAHLADVSQLFGHEDVPWPVDVVGLSDYLSSQNLPQGFFDSPEVISEYVAGTESTLQCGCSSPAPWIATWCPHLQEPDVRFRVAEKKAHCVPSLKSVYTLLEYYFTFFHPGFPVLSELDTYRLIYPQNVTTSVSAQPMSIALLNAVMFVASSVGFTQCGIHATAKQF